MNKLAELAKQRAQARALLDMHSMLNVYGLSLSEKIERDAAYQLAQSGFERADEAYRKTLASIPDDQIRQEVDAATKALLEVEP